LEGPGMTDVTIIENFSGIKVQGVALINSYISKSIDPVIACIGIGTVGPHQHILVPYAYISNQALGICSNSFISFPIIGLFNINPLFSVANNRSLL
jgi:hypothetical protein